MRKRTTNENLDTDEKPTSARRTLLKTLGLGVSGTLIFSLFTKNAQAQDQAQQKTASNGHTNDINIDSSDQITGPLQNHRWMGWENPVFDTNDGWNDWKKILNPNNLPIWYDSFSEIPKTHPKHKWGMVIDNRKCVGCQACVVACKSENNVPLGVFRTIVDVMEVGSIKPAQNGMIVTEEGSYEPNVKKFMLNRICNHCDEPPCVQVCPVKATFKRQDGIVLIDYEVCIGCGTCVQACPYDMRFLNPIQMTADKCTFCVHRVDAGLEPACVTSCVGRARVFGDLNDPNSEVSQLIAQFPTGRLMISKGTEPQVFYINLNGNLEGTTSIDKVFMEFTYTIGFNTTDYKQLGGEVELPTIEEKKNPFKQFAV